MLDGLELADGPPELFAHLGVFGGGVQRPGRRAAGVGGEQDGRQIGDEPVVERQQPVGGHLRSQPHLGGRPGRIHAPLGTHLKIRGVHSGPAPLVPQQNQTRLRAAEYRITRVTQGHRAGPPPVRERRREVGAARPVQQGGGQHGREIGAGERRSGGLLQDDGLLQEAAAPSPVLLGEVRAQQPLRGEGRPVSRRPASATGTATVVVTVAAGWRVEQFAGLRGWCLPRQQPPHGVGQLLLLLRDSDAHAQRD